MFSACFVEPVFMETVCMRAMTVLVSYCWNVKANSASLDRTTFSESHVHKLEQWIDEMDNRLPELKNFILPVSLSSPCDQLSLLPYSNPPP